MNHEYYTGEKSVTVTVGKRDIVISPADAFTNRNTEPEFETEVGGMGLAGTDELKNVQYKIEEGADLGVPGEYSVEIASYELDNADCYNVTLEGGTLTVYEDADYSKVDEAIAKADALSPDDYTNFSEVEAAINTVVRGKDITEQDKVDDMALAIENAIANLEKKPATGTTEDPSEPPTDTDKPSGDQTGNITSPETGDDSNIALWIAAMFAAGAALTGTAVYSRKRKYSR